MTADRDSDPEEVPEPPHVTGDTNRRCLGPEDIAMIKGELPPPRSEYDHLDPGVIGTVGRCGDE